MPAERHIGNIALVVRDYDEAIDFYTRALSFTLLEDTDLGAGKRWVQVAPPGGQTRLLLARAANEEQRACIGRQAGGRVFLFLETRDFWGDYRHMREQGVHFREAPREEPYGTVAVFEDCCGNPWDLLQRR